MEFNCQTVVVPLVLVPADLAERIEALADDIECWLDEPDMNLRDAQFCLQEALNRLRGVVGGGQS